MSNRAKKQNISRRNRRILVSVAAIALVLISVLAYISSTHPNTNNTLPKADSSEYFAISNLAGVYEVRSQTNSTTPLPMVLLKEFGFNFTPVGGDARDLRIFMSGFFDTTNADWEGKTITRGTSTFTEIKLPNAIAVSYDNNTGTYPFDVTFQAQEANGYVTLNFTADSLIPIVSPV